jgi:flagellum-specific peptidoglycan hydrolase FlgJ
VTTHTQAREYARAALRHQFDCDPSYGEIVALAGIACLETNYGNGWKGAGVGSHNMGAIQCGGSWTGQRFACIDTHPNTDGTSTPYRIDFRKYSSVEDGWADLVRVVYINRGRHIVREAARAESWGDVSGALHLTGYFEGFGKTVGDRIHNHMLALEGAIWRANKEIESATP